MIPRQPNPLRHPDSPFAIDYPTAPKLAPIAPSAWIQPEELTFPAHRSRLLVGALQTVSECGYPNTTVKKIVAAAGVSRRTFYEHFASKEACVLAAYDRAIDWLEGKIARAGGQAEDWATAVRAAIVTALDLLAADLRLAALCSTEILRVGRAGGVRYEAFVERLGPPLRAGRARCPWGAELPLLLEETMIRGAIWLVGYRLRDHDPHRIADLAPDVTHFLLGPYLDPSRLQEVVGGIG